MKIMPIIVVALLTGLSHHSSARPGSSDWDGANIGIQRDRARDRHAPPPSSRVRSSRHDGGRTAAYRRRERSRTSLEVRIETPGWGVYWRDSSPHTQGPCCRPPPRVYYHSSPPVYYCYPANPCRHAGYCVRPGYCPSHPRCTTRQPGQPW